jgi:hypothetical protein
MAATPRPPPRGRGPFSSREPPSSGCATGSAGFRRGGRALARSIEDTRRDVRAGAGRPGAPHWEAEATGQAHAWQHA